MRSSLHLEYDANVRSHTDEFGIMTVHNLYIHKTVLHVKLNFDKNPIHMNNYNYLTRNWHNLQMEKHNKEIYK